MKTLLIIFGSILAIMVLIIIIASRIPSFEERRKSGSLQTSTPGAPKTKKRLWPIIALILLVLVIVVGILVIKNYLNRPPTLYPIAADTQDVWINEGETVNVNIHPDYWSGWINLPPGAKFMIDAPGEIEYFFWSGKRILVKNKNTQWLAEIPDCSFKLKGAEGEATIIVEEK